jgi:hypothetical protein
MPLLTRIEAALPPLPADPSELPAGRPCRMTPACMLSCRVQGSVSLKLAVHAQM